MSLSPVPRAIAFALAAGVFVAACSKSEPPSDKPKPQVGKVSSPAADATAPQGDASDAMKERLARQEAATKMFERKNETNVLAPPPPRSMIQSSPPAPEPTKAETAVMAKPVAPTTSVPGSMVATENKPTPAPAPPPPVVTTPVPPKVASAAPTTEATKPAPAKSAPATRLVSRVEPEFPTEALRANVEHGTVKARMTLDGAGNVTRVEIVEASPRRIFDRSVTRALSQWRYSEGDPGRTVESEVDFRR
jgi:protein TonB